MGMVICTICDYNYTHIHKIRTASKTLPKLATRLQSEVVIKAMCIILNAIYMHTDRWLL